MDEQGRIRINGRKKELIIRGGENISMREVDDVVLGCPGIADYATVGVPTSASANASAFSTSKTLGGKSPSRSTM